MNYCSRTYLACRFNPLTLRIKPWVMQNFLTLILWNRPLKTIRWKAVEQYLTVELFIFQFCPVCNFGKFVHDFGLGVNILRWHLNSLGGNQVRDWRSRSFRHGDCIASVNFSFNHIRFFLCESFCLADCKSVTGRSVQRFT